jgi:large subunit ribosomal protein L23
MNNQRVMSVLLSPHISEKSSWVADKFRQFVFRVATNATKPEIKQAVEFLFKVQVVSVTVANVKGKRKKFRQTLGCRQNWKKAYVSLKEGQDLNFTIAE